MLAAKRLQRLKSLCCHGERLGTAQLASSHSSTTLVLSPVAVASIKRFPFVVLSPVAVASIKRFPFVYCPV